MEELSEAPGSAPRSRYCRSLQILRFADIGCFLSDRMLSDYYKNRSRWAGVGAVLNLLKQSDLIGGATSGCSCWRDLHHSWAIIF